MTNSDQQQATGASVPEAIDAQRARAVPEAVHQSLRANAELAEGFQHFQNAYHEEGLLDQDLLELCRTRIDALHGLESPAASGALALAQAQVAKGDFSALSAVQKRALSLAEQMAIDAHGLTDSAVAEVIADLGEPAAVSLLTAVSMHDTAVRLRRVLQPLRQAREQFKGAS